ncbi:hypothetical protein O0L34_g6593 [Tuta absoluta]|nr:hypothetical protein O0L34_g6593 [Tuta absoluta]
MCFFCGEDLPTPGDLRAHTDTHRPFSVGDRAMKLVKASDSEVKIDVSIVDCKICDESFPNLEEIVSHLSHKHKLAYNKDVDLSIAQYRLVDLKCIHCGEVFDFFYTLFKHTNSVHPSDCFVCDNCGQTFNKKRDLQLHIRINHKNEYNCSKCPLSFESNSALHTHKTNEHRSSCNVCLKIFTSNSKRLKHMKLEHDFANLQCGLCFRVLSTKQAFFTHASRCTMQKNNYKEKYVLTKSETKRPPVKLMRNNIACILNMSTAILFKYYMNKFRCFYCPKDFVESDELRQHTILEHPLCDTKLKSMKLRHRKEDGVKVDVSTLSCKLCFDHIPDLESLINHLISEHKAKYDKSVPNILQPYKLIKDNYCCPDCGEKYRYFGMLLRHIGREHTGNRKVCIYCGKCFRTDPNLRAHISRYHTAAKYHCTHCEADFSSSNDLQIHLGSKHGVKVAECPECHEKFISSYRVQRHMINVHGMGHKCCYCGKLFTKHSFMTSHVRRLHLKEKNVECSVCFEKFFDSQRLKMHMVKHVGERNFHCDLCGKKFLWKKNLRGHMASHIKHGNVPLTQV